MDRTGQRGEAVGMVLCAGLGTRLRPLTDRVPKAAVPVCGLPAVRYALALLAGAGVRRAVVNAHHLAEAMEGAARRAAEALGIELEVSREPAIAGTGGALREARDRLAGAGEILLLNGDVLFDADLGAALAAHRAAGVLATMVLAPMPEGARYAAVEVDAGLAVRRIAGRGRGGAGLSAWHFTGVHVLAPALLDLVPRRPFLCDVNAHVYPGLLDGRVRAVVDRGAWADLGAPASYLRSNLDVLSGRFPVERFRGADPFAGCTQARPGVWIGEGAAVDAGARLGGPCLVGAGARVEAGAEVGPSAVVGKGSVVRPGAIVRGSVVWEGTEIAPGERVEKAIAAGKLRVEVG
jgi:mannose-1-phosphate guanylyltransferase